MIKARHHKVIYPLFKWLSQFLIKRNFTSVCINGTYADNGKPVLVIANHVSWWDGFWVMLLNLKVIKRKFHFMMLEDQLEKHWYFKFSGGFSVKKKSRSVIDSINYSIELLQQPENMVLMFPQGQIHSMHNNIVPFEKGVKRIIQNVLPDTQILFVANLVDYFSDSKPNLFIYIKKLLAKDMHLSDVEKEYNIFYKEALNSQKTKIS